MEIDRNNLLRSGFNSQLSKTVSAVMQNEKDTSKSKKMTVPSHSHVLRPPSEMASRKLQGEKVKELKTNKELKTKIEESEKAKTSLKEVSNHALLENTLVDIVTKLPELVKFFGEGYFECANRSFSTKPVNLQHLQGHMEIMLVSLYKGLRAYCSDEHVVLPENLTDIFTCTRAILEENVQFHKDYFVSCGDVGNFRKNFEQSQQKLEEFASQTENDFVCYDYMRYVQRALRYIVFGSEKDSGGSTPENLNAIRLLSQKLLPYLRRELQSLQGNSGVNMDELTQAMNLLDLN